MTSPDHKICNRLSKLDGRLHEFRIGLFDVSQMFQTDIWGLGCCIYEVMTFRRAFKGKALWTIIREIKRGKVGIQIVVGLLGLAIFSAIVSIVLSFSKHSACIYKFLTLS